MRGREQALRKSMRLRTPREFRETFAAGKRLRSQSFTFVARSNGIDTPRLGLAVSKKHLARAVDRNHIKRIVRESFRHQATSLPCMDVVVLSTQATRHQADQELKHTLDALWQKLRNLGLKQTR